MSGRTGIAASLGALQHMRKGTAGIQAVESLSAEVPKYPARFAGTAKNAHPDYTQLKAYVRKDTKRRAMRRAEDQGYEDFSTLVQELLEKYLGS